MDDLPTVVAKQALRELSRVCGLLEKRGLRLEAFLLQDKLLRWTKELDSVPASMVVTRKDFNTVFEEWFDKYGGPALVIVAAVCGGLVILSQGTAAIAHLLGW